MLDARNVYRKVTRKIYDFSAEQQQNLAAVVWLYRGENQRCLNLLDTYVDESVRAASACFENEYSFEGFTAPVEALAKALQTLQEKMKPWIQSLGKATPAGPSVGGFTTATAAWEKEIAAFGLTFGRAPAKGVPCQPESSAPCQPLRGVPCQPRATPRVYPFRGFQP